MTYYLFVHTYRENYLLIAEGLRNNRDADEFPGAVINIRC